MEEGRREEQRLRKWEKNIKIGRYNEGVREEERQCKTE